MYWSRKRRVASAGHQPMVCALGWRKHYRPNKPGFFLADTGGAISRVKGPNTGGGCLGAKVVRGQHCDSGGRKRAGGGSWSRGFLGAEELWMSKRLMADLDLASVVASTYISPAPRSTKSRFPSDKQGGVWLSPTPCAIKCGSLVQRMESPLFPAGHGYARLWRVEAEVRLGSKTMPDTASDDQPRRGGQSGWPCTCGGATGNTRLCDPSSAVRWL